MSVYKNIFGDIDEIIIISMAKGWGGAEEYLENLTDQLSGKGINYHIIVREGGEYSKRCANKDKILEIPHNIIGFLRNVPKNLKRRSSKIIHVNRYYDILRGWYLKKIMPNSILILYQQCYLNHPHRIPLSLTDGIICISDFVKTSIVKKFPVFAKKTIVINPGIDLGLFNKEKKDYRINSKIKVGMAGRFDKNQEDLIHVAWELKKRGIPITVYFVGNGKPEEERNLKKLSERLGISENMVFRGSIPRQSMSHFYLDMDIVVSTMKREGLSLVAIEAMASGLPFIAYNAPGFNEVIDNEENGILVNGGIKEFASTIQFLIESTEIRKRIGQNAIKKAKKYFGIETNVNRYLNFISDLLIKKRTIM